MTIFSRLCSLKNRSNIFLPSSSRPAHLLSGWMSYPIRFSTCRTRFRHGQRWLCSAHECMLVMYLLLNIFFNSVICGLSFSYFSFEIIMSRSISKPSFSSCGLIFNALQTNVINPSSVVIDGWLLVILKLHIFINNFFHKKYFFCFFLGFWLFVGWWMLRLASSATRLLIVRE